MNNTLLQSNAHVKVLEYKLHNIKTYINSRLDVVDPITKIELNIILSLISKYETVNADWKLPEPLVELKDNIKEASTNE